MTQPWWKTATGYQIYPRSFCDSNGDGIGDIPGIISKLGHLEELGIGFIWLCPVYASPMRDNGYDIADYRNIAPEFGTMEDFERLLAEARGRGIRIVMDLVVNHCSNDHPWFQAACASREVPEHDYFYWRAPGPDGGPPDDQRACFGGSAWHWVEAVGKYAYCHFGPQQPDLNWQNPALRAEIYDMMNWWLDKGLGGFRLDVIDLLGKDIDARIYHDAPDLHPLLAEMHSRCFAGRDIVTVGEAWSARPETALSYTGRARRELDMVFSFNHIEAGWDPIKGRYGGSRFDLVTHKSVLADWQTALAEDGWNSLYLSNHDLPRPVSFYGDEGPGRVASAKMLATVTYLMRGTPFVFQGEEIGMTNADFASVDQFRDIEALGQAREQLALGVSEAEFVAGARVNGRDNARTPVQWSSACHAGFTTGTPWIDVNANHTHINVAADKAAPDGIFAHYRELIGLRRILPVISQGDFQLLWPEHPDLFAYTRRLRETVLFVLGNFSGKPVTLDRDELPKGPWTSLLAPFPEVCLFDPAPQLPPYYSGAWISSVAD
ncbi:MAG: alpha-glucosidase [Pseudomonadota bacterium]